MRFILLTLFICVLSTTLSAQIIQKIDIPKNLIHKKYKLTSFVRTYDTGLIECWTFQKDHSGKFLKDKSKKTQSSKVGNNWIRLTHSGSFQKNVSSFTFGIFSFKTIHKLSVDLITLEVFNNNSWDSIELKNNNFEILPDSSNNVFGWDILAGYRWQIDTTNFYSGKKSLSLSKEELLQYGDFNVHGNLVQLNDASIYYETYGQGEPLLLLHGNNESIQSFRYQIDYFRKKYKVIAVDSRGQGKSTNNKRKINYELMADDMNKLLNHLKLDSINILGWSDGGNTGLCMAIRYPRKVKSLVIMGANLYPNKGAVQKKFMRDYRWSLRYARLLALIKPSEWHNKIIVGKMVLKEPRMTPAALASIHAPVLVMAGEKDVINESHTQLIARNISRSKLVILKGLTHYAPQENPVYFNKEVDDFISEVLKKR